MATDSGPGPTSDKLRIPLRRSFGATCGLVTGCQTTGSIGTGQKRRYASANESRAKGRTRRGNCIVSQFCLARDPDTVGGHHLGSRWQRQRVGGFREECKALVTYQVLEVLAEETALRNHNQRVLHPG